MPSNPYIPGGLVNLFGGCAPGTSVPLDTHLVHYSELTLKGVYHHRPDTFRRAVAFLADPEFKADFLLSGVRPIAEVVDALRSMIRKEALKIVIRNMPTPSPKPPNIVIPDGASAPVRDP